MPDQRSLFSALLVVCQSLRNNCSDFDELIASFMYFGDVGMKAISQLFTGSTIFASIDVSNSSCTHRAMESLASSIKRSSLIRLRCLNVSGNRIGDRGISTILSALIAVNARLEVLACKQCDLSSAGFEDLGNNPINDSL
jgi:hypothetical protein